MRIGRIVVVGGRIAALLFPLVVAAVVTGPWIAQRGFVRDPVFRRFFPEFNGTLRTSSAELGWFSPVVYHDVELFTPRGERVVHIDRLVGQKPLWLVLLRPSTPGDYQLDGFTVELRQRAKGTNAAELLPFRPRDRMLSTRISVADGQVVIHPENGKPWRIAPLEVAWQMEPETVTPSGQPEAVVEPGVLFRHVRLPSQSASGLLREVLPILSKAAEIEGEISLALDHWRVPLDNPEQSTGDGRLTVDYLDVSVPPTGLGAIVQKFTEAIKVPTRVRAAQDLVVPWRLSQGRIEVLKPAEVRRKS